MITLNFFKCNYNYYVGNSGILQKIFLKPLLMLPGVIGEKFSGFRIMKNLFLQPKAESEGERTFNLADVNFRVQRSSGVRQDVRS